MLVTITLCTALVVLMIWAAKVSAEGEMLMPGTATPLPVPERPMLCGEPGALLTMLMLPVSAAAVSGVKVTLMAQLPAGTTGGVSSGQVLVKPKSPVPVMLDITRLAVPLLERVTAVGGLVVLTVRAPKLMLGGVRVTPADGAAVTVRLKGVALLLPAGVTMRPAAMVPE